MASFDKKEEETLAAPQTHKIRIIMSCTSKNLKDLEKLTNELITRAKDKGLHVSGPARQPLKNLKITTRKTPCGEGSKTWDRYQMRIHKRHIDLWSPAEVVKQITSINIEPGVNVEIIINRREDA